MQCAISWPSLPSQKINFVPEMTGDENPPPIAMRQVGINSFESLPIAAASAPACPFRNGPRHCGQSSPRSVAAIETIAEITKMLAGGKLRRLLVELFTVGFCCIFGSGYLGQT